MMLVAGVCLALMLPDMCFGRRDLSRAKGRAQGGWELIWADEFDFFDTNKWEYQYEDGCKLGICHWGNKEKVCVYYCPPYFDCCQKFNRCSLPFQCSPGIPNQMLK